MIWGIALETIAIISLASWPLTSMLLLTELLRRILLLLICCSNVAGVAAGVALLQPEIAAAGIAAAGIAAADSVGLSTDARNLVVSLMANDHGNTECES